MLFVKRAYRRARIASNFSYAEVPLVAYPCTKLSSMLI